VLFSTAGYVKHRCAGFSAPFRVKPALASFSISFAPCRGWRWRWKRGQRWWTKISIWNEYESQSGQLLATLDCKTHTRFHESEAGKVYSISWLWHFHSVAFFYTQVKHTITETKIIEENCDSNVFFSIIIS